MRCTKTGPAFPSRGWAPVLLTLLLLASCEWYGWVPKERPLKPLPAAPTSMDPLTLGEPVSGEIRCRENDCNHWYRLRVEDPGVLHARVEPTHQGHYPLVRVVIQRFSGPVLDRVVSDTGPPLEASTPVEPGTYLVLVQSLAEGVPYVLVAELREEAVELRDGAALTRCTGPRGAPCSFDYLPVCGFLEGGGQKTYSNACSACADPAVVGHTPGACP